MDARRRILSAVIKQKDIVIDTNFISKYLTIEALEDGLTAKLSINNCEYCVDGDGDWKTLTADTYTPAINRKHVISFRANLTGSSSNGIGTFTINKKCNLKGNCMSMLYSDDASDNVSVGTYAFQALFQNATAIIDASELQMPATTLANYCYRNMFQGCDGLIYPPKILPAKTAKSYCYYSMFGGCSSLIETPELPATTLGSYCYNYMFNGCSKLTKVSDLPAKTCTTYCYAYMFQNCKAIVNPPNISATTLNTYCFHSMFRGCTKLASAPQLPVTSLKSYCYSNMFRECTGITTAPELPATALQQSCYSYMFYGCKNLTTAPELLATTLATYSYHSMFYNCNKLDYIKMLATNISASDCLKNWLYGVSSTGTFVKHPDMNDLSTGVSGIPSGWTVVDNV